MKIWSPFKLDLEALADMPDMTAGIHEEMNRFVFAEMRKVREEQDRTAKEFMARTGLRPDEIVMYVHTSMPTDYRKSIIYHWQFGRKEIEIDDWSREDYQCLI